MNSPTSIIGTGTFIGANRSEDLNSSGSTSTMSAMSNSGDFDSTDGFGSLSGRDLSLVSGDFDSTDSLGSRAGSFVNDKVRRLMDSYKEFLAASAKTKFEERVPDCYADDAELCKALTNVSQLFTSAYKKAFVDLDALSKKIAEYVDEASDESLSSLSENQRGCIKKALKVIDVASTVLYEHNVRVRAVQIQHKDQSCYVKDELKKTVSMDVATVSVDQDAGSIDSQKDDAEEYLQRVDEKIAKAKIRSYRNGGRDIQKILKAAYRQTRGALSGSAAVYDKVFADLPEQGLNDPSFVGFDEV